MHFNKHILRAFLLALVLGVAAARQVHAGPPVTLTHVHGLSYSADGRQLLVPSHHGLAVFENGRWSKAAGPAHDYMGFSATRDALYSSGHPAPGSGLINPFGLIKSRDGGKTWHKLGLEGESDFHTLATSWGTNAVYVFNPGPSSRMSQAGIHFTLNDGLKWTRLGQGANCVESAGDDPELFPNFAQFNPFLDMGNETWLFYCETNGTHGVQPFEKSRGRICAGVWRKDGFVSLDSSAAGTLITKPIVFDGKELLVNFVTQDGGSVRVGCWMKIPRQSRSSTSASARLCAATRWRRKSHGWAEPTSRSSAASQCG